MSEQRAYFVITAYAHRSGSVAATLEELATEVNKYLTEHPECYPCGAPIFVPGKNGEGFWGWAQIIARK